MLETRASPAAFRKLGEHLVLLCQSYIGGSIEPIFVNGSKGSAQDQDLKWPLIGKGHGISRGQTLNGS